MTSLLGAAYHSKEAPLVLQLLDYTENPVDIPNPDRGFFRDVVNKKKVSVILKARDGSKTYNASTSLDARYWLTDETGDSRADNSTAWRDLNFSINMSALGKLPRGEYDIFLKINDPKKPALTDVVYGLRIRVIVGMQILALT